MHMYMDRPDTYVAVVNIWWTNPQHFFSWQHSPTLNKQIPVIDTNALWVVIVVDDTERSDKGQRNIRQASVSQPLSLALCPIHRGATCRHCNPQLGHVT